VCRPLKIHFKKPRWRTAVTFERPVLYHHQILQFFDFQDGGCSPSWSFKIEIFSTVLQNTFCAIVLNFAEIGPTVAQISQFLRLRVKCKNSLDDLAQYGITSSKLETTE